MGRERVWTEASIGNLTPDLGVGLYLKDREAPADII